MASILLNSRVFVIQVIFFHILPFSNRGKNFRRRKMTKFWLGEENFPRRKVLPDKIFIDKIIVFPKSVVTPSKIRTVNNFYAKALKRFPEKCFRVLVDLACIGQITFSWNFENDWNKNVNFKIVLIGENSFMQMYCSKISFFTDLLLRIKWLCAKSVKITIQKNSYPKK